MKTIAFHAISKTASIGNLFQSHRNFNARISHRIEFLTHGAAMSIESQERQVETRYIVCDPAGSVSYNRNEAESFKTFRGPKGAAARAKELAEEMPGQVIRIYELTAEVVVPVNPAETSRKHPIEHYK